MLDADLVEIYGVATKNWSNAVKRNAEQFPPGFVFLLAPQEVTNLRFQSGTSSCVYSGQFYLSFALTKQGTIMAANVQTGIQGGLTRPPQNVIMEYNMCG